MNAAVFEGGGFNGAASQRRYTQTAREDVSLYSGDSIGAVLAYLNAIDDPATVDGYWDQMSAKDLYRGGSWLDKALTLAGRRRGIYDMRPSLDTLRELVRGRRIRPGVTVAVTTADLRYSVRRVVHLTAKTPADECIRWVYRSTLVPVAHGADENRWADGGVYGAAPIAPVVDLGADHVDVYLLNPIGVSGRWDGGNAISEASRAVDSMREALIARDLEATHARNVLPLPGDRDISITVHEPLSALPGWMDASKPALSLRRAIKWQALTLNEAMVLQSAREAEAERRSLAG